LRIGIKYCGGCNPKYDRADFVDRLKEKFRGRMEFDTAKEGLIYDALLVIGGCRSCCADYGRYKAGRKVLLVRDANQFDVIVKELEELFYL
jgi:hypothetical protein